MKRRVILSNVHREFPFAERERPRLDETGLGAAYGSCPPLYGVIHAVRTGDAMTGVPVTEPEYSSVSVLSIAE